MDYLTILLQKVRVLLSEEFSIPESIEENIIHMIEYTVEGGKMIRGLFTVYSVYLLCDSWNEEMKEQ